MNVINKITEKLQIEDETKVLTQETLKKDYRKFILDLCPKVTYSKEIIYHLNFF